MENQFVPYELAVKLKELGFNEPCLKAWGKTYASDKEYKLDEDYCTHNWNEYNKVYSAPLWQQAFDWFREKHNIIGETLVFAISWIEKDKWAYQWRIYTYENRDNWECSPDEYKTYEEARLACLEKLIEVVEKTDQ